MSRPLAVLLLVAVAAAAAWWIVSGDDAEDVEVDVRRPAGPAAEAPVAPAVESGRPDAAAAAPAPAAEDQREEAAAPADEGSPPVAEGEAELAWGTVLDPWGEPVVGADVHAFVPGFRGIGGKVVAATKTDRTGAFSFGVPRERRTVRVDVLKEGYRGERREGPFRDLRVVLHPLRASRIEGRLLAPSGAPLTPGDLAFLFGTFGPDAPPPPPFLEPSAIVAAPDRSLGQPEVEREAEIHDDATFTVEQPAFFAGEIVLLFRGMVLARHPWKDGDPPVTFEVDVRTLRRALGRLEVVLEDVSLAPDEPVEVDVLRRTPVTRRDATETFAATPPGPLVVEGLPAGSYRVVARRHDVLGRAEADVPAGGSATATVALDPRARVRLRLRWTDGEPMQAGEVHVVHRDPAGTELEVDQHPRTAGGGVEVAVEAAPGPGAFVLDGNVLPVDLAPGENADLDWELRRSRRVVLRAGVTAPSRADGPREAAVQVRLETRSGAWAVDRRTRVPVAADGTAVVPVHVPPGRYRLVLDFGELRRIEASLVVTADDDQEHAFPLESP